jgi:hypothetical protein
VSRAKNPKIPRVDIADVAFAGEHGEELSREIGRVSAGLTSVEEASGVSRRTDGKLEVMVSPETLRVLSGRAKI